MAVSAASDRGVVGTDADAVPAARADAVPAAQPAAAPEPQRALGPLVAVAAACGGAGATTLAYLIARDAAGDGGQPVLVCDTGGPTGGLAAYARVSAPRSLPRAANAIAANAALSEGLFAVAESQLRVVASGPDLDEEVDERGLDRLLADAREAHRLTVVDCGTLGGAVAARVLAAATHLIWVIPATRSGIRRARPVLELLGIEPERRELVVARRDASGRRSPVEDLATLAEARAAPLVLMPHVSDLGERDAEDGLEAGAVALDAIRSVVSRSGS